MLPLQVDHRYSPLWWQTLICLPDDPVKTIVGREGQFFLDYGSGGPRNFLTNVQFDLANGATWIDQELPEASVPVLITCKSGPGLTIEETAFLQIPAEGESTPEAVRYDGFEILEGWANPAVPCDPAFRNAAVRYPSGSHEASLEIHLRVEPHGVRTVALGFCEGIQTEPGMRRSIARVEGADAREIDPVRDFGPNVPGVHLFEACDTNGDGWILVSLKFHPDTHFVDGADRASDLRTIMLSALWSFLGEAPPEAEIVSGRVSGQADLYRAGTDLLLPHRRNHLLIRLTNETGETQTVRPILRVRGVQEPTVREGRLRIGPHNVLASSLGFGEVTLIDDAGLKDVAVERAGIGGTGGREWTVNLGETTLGPGEQRSVAVTLDRFARTASPDADSDASAAALNDAQGWWLANGPSQHMVAIPDAGIQRMVDSCVRNIFQARDIRNGLPSFHVGPTIYRGLFLADGAFMLELATMLDRVEEARAGVAYLQGFEHPEGGFNVIDTYYKENGMAAFAIIRHARLTDDREWLRSKWSTVRGCVRRIQSLRRQTPKGAANEGLLPAGAFCDGGVFNNGRPFGDYSNSAWCLSGLKWAYEAADWIGEDAEATEWRAEYEDFRETFRRAAQRDLREDAHGNRYLPIVQGNGDEHAPPRGQWAFCHSVYPGGIYERDDVIALGNLAMLGDAMVEGVVLDTGWMHGGLWPYFSSFYAHALQWMGMGERAPQILYDFANHASPTLVWREEQKPQGLGYEEVGDMPHNWASTEFLRMAVHMLQLDRGDELHLLEGFPAAWAAPGLETRLRGIRTPFGTIDLELTGREEGVQIRLAFAGAARLPRRIVVHRRAWGGDGEVDLPVSPVVEEVVPLRS
ncbi:MAG: hypothetical protein ACO1SV_02470 [Fimbriimonas sp.]